MDFWDLTLLIVRRWYVAVPLLLITMISAVWVWANVTPNYQATAYVQLIPPSQKPGSAPQDEPVNPWLDLGIQSLTTAATFTTVNEALLREFKAAGLSDNVTITEGYPNPVATIVVVGDSKEQATATANEVVRRYIESVGKLQADRGVRANSVISALRLDVGDNLEEVGGKVKRAVIVVLAAGLLMTAGLTVAFDAFMRRRAFQRTQDEIDEPVEVEPPVRRPARTGKGNAGQGGGSGSAKAGSGRGGSGRGPNRAGSGRPAGAGKASTGSQARPSREPGFDPPPALTGSGSGSTATGIDVEYSTGTSRGSGAANPVPEDATIVLPLSMWPPRSDENGRRRR